MDNVCTFAFALCPLPKLYGKEIINTLQKHIGK